MLHKVYEATEYNQHSDGVKHFPIKSTWNKKALCWYFDKLHLDNSAEGELCSSVSLWRTFFRNFSRLECTPSLWYLLVGIKQNFASFVNVHSQTRVFEMHKTVKPDETFLRHEMIKKWTSLTNLFSHSMLIQLCDHDRWPLWCYSRKSFMNIAQCKWHFKIIKDYEIISFLRWISLARTSRPTR